MTDKPKNDEKPKNTLITGNGGRWLLFNMLLAVSMLWVLQWLVYLTRPNFFVVVGLIFVNMAVLSLLQVFDLPAPLVSRRGDWLVSVGLGTGIAVLIIFLATFVIQFWVMYFVGGIYGAAVGWQLGQRFHVGDEMLARGRVMSGQALAFTVLFISQLAVGIIAGYWIPTDRVHLVMSLLTAGTFALLQYFSLSHYLD